MLLSQTTNTAAPYGLTAIPAPGAITPTRMEGPRLNTKRKQTLLSLLDALNELNKDVDHDMRDGNQQPSFEDDRDVPTVDEHNQVVGAEVFGRFQKRISGLDKELRNFANASRQLGSSVGILSSAASLRERLAHILYLFRENAADLFPRRVSRQHRETPNIPILKNPKKKRKPTSPSTPAPDDKLDLENLPSQLESLAVDVTTFLNCLNEFPEFTDEAVNASIKSFDGDLRYWASCLSEYHGQLRYPAVQRYIHDLSSEMGEHIDSITSTLSMFIEIGVPTIRFAQKHGASNLLNLSTVATFFSAVTATTLQFSFNMTGTPMADAVNSFWFCSLVFSIGAAVNSLLGLTWKQAMYRSPGNRVPWWVSIWIKRSPLVFLVMSVACFSVGLVLFTYSSQQSRTTCIITSVFTAFTSFGLAAVSAWFASERWIFLQHRGQKWLGDVLTDFKNSFLALRGMVAIRNALDWCLRRLQSIGGHLTRVSSFSVNLLASSGEKLDDGSTEDGSLPYTNGDHHLPHLHPLPQSPRARSSDLPPSPSSPDWRASPASPYTSSEAAESTATTNASLSPKGRFVSAVRSVITLQPPSSVAGVANLLTAPRRQRTTSSNLAFGEPFRKRTQAEPVTMLRSSRVANLVPKLQALKSTYDLEAHTALVRHLQFSPNGKFLATSSWDKTSVMFRVGNPFTSHRVLAHPQGFVGQVAWSPNGNYLLTKLNRGIKVWTEDGVCKKTIVRDRTVQSIAWLPGGDAFLSVEGSDVTKLDTNGKVLDIYKFDRIILHDVVVTPDCQRLLGVGPLTASPTGLVPSKSRVEKRLVVYNLDTKATENQTPVLNDVRDITLARNGVVVLISYENKAPPQLWKLDHVKTQNTMRLSLRHTYMPKVPVDFAGPSYFGGKDDQLVLCAGKAGDIHIWDRESAALLHHVRAQALGGDLTCIAWNHAAENPFMFATGSHDGAVRIWTSPPSETPSETPSQDQSRARTPYEGTPRTGTPQTYDLDPDFRTESPTTQQEFEMLHSDDAITRHGRTISFTPPQALGSMYDERQGR